ncbi:tryptophan--tRNA ligase [Mycoplasma marinum]|uniref:Tryptophan--tRNA ligase n=1 Tax=Mycoplasma marinum TaxID=1937190 RepID=A0A4R0XJR4_9MOLU|nr:tryptophan--tRNA ligase [Mycoplasma marinum]TCG10684.1 tryptophan--tRNA ligase [Mycoplasma marinum]
MKKRILSGITATGTLTIGNYLGAIKNFVKLQEEFEMFIFVADLHALTNPIEPKELRKNKKNIMALYIACGLDPEKTTLFNQSDVKEHGHMSWLISSQTTIGELNRMTQFKDKSSKVKSSNGTEMIPTGLLIYPALMAGDILLYNPDLVPVGADQKQHLELTRNIATRINNKFGDTFKIPKPYIAKEGAKIMSLTDPTSKMSKSSPNAKSHILLLDDPELAASKIRKAVTDSENKVYVSPEKPGVTNLLTIYAGFKDITIAEAAEYFKNHNYKDFKDEIAVVVKEFLINIQAKYKDAILNVKEIAEQGALKASQQAIKSSSKLERRLGLK